jgi:uncharacterized protein YjiS (DUF1127 family)
MTTMHIEHQGERIGRYWSPVVRHPWRDAAQRVGATLGEWRRRSREREQLARLDDRMLSDIGITRVDALFLSSKPFWQE